MKPARGAFAAVMLTALALIIISCGGGGPPQPGREIDMPKVGIRLVLSEGWEAEVVSTDWAMWGRIERGRGEEPWVIPPLTATNVAAGAQGAADRYMSWRLKGVRGNFDPTVNPLTSQYPVPPGLWSLDPLKLDLLETRTQLLPWSGLSEVEATCRLYENTHGTGMTSAIWHTYTVIFDLGPNAYEFVMSIPDTPAPHDWIDEFWTSIVSLTIESD